MRDRRRRRWSTVSLVLLDAPDRQDWLATTAVASVVEQLYPRWELWAPPALASRAGGGVGDRRIRVLPESDSADPAATFNVALAAAAGVFIAPLLPDCCSPSTRCTKWPML